MMSEEKKDDVVTVVEDKRRFPRVTLSVPREALAKGATTFGRVVVEVDPRTLSAGELSAMLDLHWGHQAEAFDLPGDAVDTSLGEIQRLLIEAKAEHEAELAAEREEREAHAAVVEAVICGIIASEDEIDAEVTTDQRRWPEAAETFLRASHRLSYSDRDLIEDDPRVAPIIERWRERCAEARAEADAAKAARDEAKRIEREEHGARILAEMGEYERLERWNAGRLPHWELREVLMDHLALRICATRIEDFSPWPDDYSVGEVVRWPAEAWAAYKRIRDTPGIKVRLVRIMDDDESCDRPDILCLEVTEKTPCCEVEIHISIM